ncbi:MAG: hypothetical protein Q7R94_01135 [bacterium]|nr:hypothetical protein [bacterium]
MRRYLYLLGILAIIAVVVAVGYFLRYRSRDTVIDPNALTPGGLPPVGDQTGTPSPVPPGGTPPTSFVGQKFGVVGENKVLSFYVDAQNNALLVQPDGQIVKIAGNNATTLSSSAIANLREARFSADGNKILAIFGDSGKPQISVFDVASKSWQPLLLNIKSASWASTGYQLAYFVEKNGAKALTALDISNPKAKPVELFKMHAEDLMLDWINPNQIIIRDKGSAIADGSVWSFDIKTKTLKGFVSEKPGLASLWSGKANMGLVFAALSSSRRGGGLTLYDTAGNALSGLKLSTLPAKCAFDAQPAAATPSLAATSTKTTASKATSTPQVVLEKSLYCAIPRDSQKFGASRLPDDYEKKILFTADDFYKVNLSDGAVSSVFAEQAQMLDATELKVFNQTLFFINRLDQRLYAISLK